MILIRLQRKLNNSLVINMKRYEVQVNFEDTKTKDLQSVHLIGFSNRRIAWKFLKLINKLGHKWVKK